VVYESSNCFINVAKRRKNPVRAIDLYIRIIDMVNRGDKMDISIFFARLWGSFFVIFGLLGIITKQLGKTIEMTKDKAFVISTGYITMLMGLVTVILHNVWVWNWKVAITVLGWSTLLKGIGKIGFPELIHKQAQRFKKNQWVSAAILIALGVWLFWMSFL
jgi:hypothetical protein